MLRKQRFLPPQTLEALLSRPLCLPGTDTPAVTHCRGMSHRQGFGWRLVQAQPCRHICGPGSPGPKQPLTKELPGVGTATSASLCGTSSRGTPWARVPFHVAPRTVASLQMPREFLKRCPQIPFLLELARHGFFCSQLRKADCPRFSSAELNWVSPGGCPSAPLPPSLSQEARWTHSPSRHERQPSRAGRW